jgi:hypothetical protein
VVVGEGGGNGGNSDTYLLALALGSSPGLTKNARDVNIDFNMNGGGDGGGEGGSGVLSSACTQSPP